MPEIIFLKSAIKDIATYDQATRQRLIQGIEKIPRGDIKKLQGKGNVNFFRLRVGKFRIIYCVDDEKILITKIDSRGDVYK